MTGTSFKGKVLVMSVFVLGIVTGILTMNVYETRLGADDRGNPANRTARAQQDIKTFHDYLGLNAEQREQIHQIMTDMSPQFQSLREQTRPQFDALVDEMRTRIRAVLNDEQKRKYDEFRNKRQPQRGQRPRPN